MNILEERILKEAKILPGNIVKVSGFLNHQVDVNLLNEMSNLYYEHFKDKKIDKVLTIEASGIPLAYACAQKFNVPMIFAKKSKSANLENVYTSKVTSYTYHNEYQITVAKELCHKGDNILIVDDFLAIGNALKGLIEICDQAKMNVAGFGIAIEKGFQGGGDKLREEGYDVCSLAIIDSIEDGKIVFRNN